MKFGKHLEDNLNPEWEEYYIAYNNLKKLIKEAAVSAATSDLSTTPREASLSVFREHEDDCHSRFFSALNAEVKKVGDFTEGLVSGIKADIDRISQIVDSSDDLPPETLTALSNELKELGQRFLATEKYVNINYMGFHKILKKHDKKLPSAPCYQFYLAHLHRQPWTQGGYSELLVKLSDVHSRLRKDISGEKDEGASQGFIRSTQKFWVRNQDISTVKYHILQNLPVFRFDENNFSGDAQLISSVYLDNDLLELYHGRLDKKPGAIAVRVRWYGSNQPNGVFVERKTHREKWKGELSVKERFGLKADQVVSFLNGALTLDQAVARLKEKGKSEKDIKKFSALFSEVQQQVDSKQLKSFIRTSYMRTAFQIPYNASVRISLDTNLSMMKENPKAGPTNREIGRWYRDPSLPIASDEITHFPHGVLEIKLSLREGEEVPPWVTDLMDSGYLTEVHKFSKFIHGTATLFPDQVQAVPYWIDDDSIRASIVHSAPLGEKEALAVPEASSAIRIERDRDSDLTHPLLADRSELNLISTAKIAANKRRSRAPGASQSETIVARLFPFKGLKEAVGKAQVMRLEPKVFFANERTFMSWMEIAITLASVSTILLGISTSDSGSGLQTVELISLIMLPLGIIVAIYATAVYWWRAKRIGEKQAQFIHDETGTVGLGALMLVCMVTIFVIALVDYIKDALDR